MDDRSIASELVDLSAISLRELLATTDPAILASAERVVDQVLSHEDPRDGPCGPDRCGY